MSKKQFEKIKAGLEEVLTIVQAEINKISEQEEKTKSDGTQIGINNEDIKKILENKIDRFKILLEKAKEELELGQERSNRIRNNLGCTAQNFISKKESSK